MFTLTAGSPPRAWGRLAGVLSVHCGARFTPTGVGTATAPAGPPSSAPVHPHGRGDGLDRHPGSWYCRGSPPRAWGRPAQGCTRLHVVRFTPTGVGTAPPWLRRVARDAVHPHGRGDGGRAQPVVVAHAGSPPRAWGRRRQPRGGSTYPRFTPTGVGTAFCAGADGVAEAVHPHGRGDGTTSISGCRLSAGSPPRAWGRRAARRLSGRSCRFTPTGVGTAVLRGCI